MGCGWGAIFHCGDDAFYKGRCLLLVLSLDGLLIELSPVWGEELRGRSGGR